MKVKYIKNIMNLKDDGTSTDTLAVIGEEYKVVSTDGSYYNCWVNGQEIVFMVEEVERVLEPWTDYGTN